tara:strand:+ start:468 stop:590 length:123 start_codon:yes stop_codon:yes gene_type:complete
MGVEKKPNSTLPRADRAASKAVRRNAHQIERVVVSFLAGR